MAHDHPAEARTRYLDATPRTALITAFPPEWDALAHMIAQPRELAINGNVLIVGTMDDHPVALMQSGISMVNAAMHTQALLDHFRVRRILFSGIAGGVDPELRVGDVVAPERWGQNMEVAFAREIPGGYDPPRGLPGGTDLPGHGPFFPRDVIAGNAEMPARERRWFPVDAELLAAARNLAIDAPLSRKLPAATDDGQDSLDHQPRLIVGGNGVSGSAFVDNAAYRAYLAEIYGARVVDMETAAVAQVAWTNNVPFIAFRSLSDLAGGDSGPNTMRVFMALAAGNSAAIVRSFVKALHP